jgi:glycosyltransferase involved in cell wall biosynthesis
LEQVLKKLYLNYIKRMKKSMVGPYKAVALCPTYHRPRLLEESIQCFLDQTWENKHLFILNDHQIPLQMDKKYSSITIMNVSKRYNSLGDKRNVLKYLALQSGADFIFHWDDDDLYFPKRMEHSIKVMEDNPDIDVLSPSNCLWNLGEWKIIYNNLESQCCIKSTYAKKNSYTTKNDCNDILDFFEKARQKGTIDRRASEEWYMIYRWGMGTFHLSGMGSNPENWSCAEQYFKDKELGSPILIPQLREDYFSIAEKEISKL